MADFKKFIPLLKKLEGGFVDHPADKGGATNMGVTLKTFREHYGNDKSVHDLKHMSNEQWGHIMNGYWDKCKADEIMSQSVAEIFVDWCVNSGLAGIRRVQEIAGVRPDGIVGPVTVNAINAHSPEDLFNRIKDARKQFYVNIVRRDPSQKVFMNGWMNRIESFTFKG